MSYNGSGTFNINSTGQPVVTGTVISSSVFNALTADLATGLSTCITKDGQTTVTANIPMNSFKFTNLAAGTAAGDSVRVSQLQAGSATSLTVTGTNTYAATASPALTAYTTGNTFSFVVPNSNTSSCTLNIDSLGAKAITRDGTTALVSGDLVAGSEVLVVYDGTQFQVVNSNSKTNLNLSGTLTVAGNATFSGGTANGVGYLNGSKVLTTGSALTFDGTTLVGNAAYGSGTAALILKNTSASSTANIVEQQFWAGDTFTGLTQKGAFGLDTSTGVGNQYGSFYWKLANAGAPTEQMRLTSSGLEVKQSQLIGYSSYAGIGTNGLAVAGNVGIGTSSPGVKLDVSYSDTAYNPGIRVKNTSNNSASQSKVYVVNDADAYFSLGRNSTVLGSQSVLFSTGSYPIDFYTDSTFRATIDASGNFGVNTNDFSSYSNLFGVKKDQNSATRALVNNQANNASASAEFVMAAYGNSWITGIGSSLKNSNALTWSLDATSATPSVKMTLTTSGRLGIGNTSPDTTLAIGSSAGSGSNGLGIYLARGATTNFLEAYDGTKTFIGGTDSTNGYVKVGSLSNHPVAIVQSNGAAIYINTSKNVGIGNTAPTTRLAVTLDTDEAASMTSLSGSGGGLSPNQGEIREVGFSVVSGTNFVISSIVTTSTGWRAVFRGTWSNNVEGGGLSFYAPYIELNSANPSTSVGSVTVTISRNGSGYLIANTDSANRVNFAGTVEIYQNPTSVQPSQSMRLLGGIQFPATQNDSSNANTLDDYEEGTWTPTANDSVSITVTSAKYVKIGSSVTVTAYITYASNTSVAAAIISGFPFTFGTYQYIGAESTSSAAVQNLECTINTTDAYVRNANAGTVLNSSLSGRYIIFNGTYLI